MKLAFFNYADSRETKIIFSIGVNLDRGRPENNFSIKGPKKIQTVSSTTNTVYQARYNDAIPV